jgi:hypothetical protein
VVAWAVISGAALVVLGPARWWLGLVGEAATYLVLGLALACWRPWRRLCAGLSSRRRCLPAVLLFVLLFGQLAGGTRLAFPLARFSMYSDELGSTEVVHAIEAVGRDGERTVVLQPSLFAFWRSYRFTGLIDQISGQHAVDDGCGGFADLVRVVAGLPEWRRSEDGQLARFDVVATTYDLRHLDGGTPSVAGRSVVCSLDVAHPPDGSRPTER